ncbi:hypothetical protein C8R43DRAFT_1138562 [Mycena crocata]|nr:hypothetical protein C8R43DRAFT_1138562 [Mycena crocata]
MIAFSFLPPPSTTLPASTLHSSFFTGFIFASTVPAIVVPSRQISALIQHHLSPFDLFHLAASTYTGLCCTNQSSEFHPAGGSFAATVIAGAALASSASRLRASSQRPSTLKKHLIPESQVAGAISLSTVSFPPSGAIPAIPATFCCPKRPGSSFYYSSRIHSPGFMTLALCTRRLHRLAHPTAVPAVPALPPPSAAWNAPAYPSITPSASTPRRIPPPFPPFPPSFRPLPPETPCHLYPILDRHLLPEFHAAGALWASAMSLSASRRSRPPATPHPLKRLVIFIQYSTRILSPSFMLPAPRPRRLFPLAHAAVATLPPPSAA